MRTRMGLCTLAVLAVACGDDEVDPVGDLSRPSGLLYVERDVTAGDQLLRRGDLFIADSEVEGVRLLQFRRRPSDNTNGFVVERRFAISPAVLSTLVISTPGFPTELAFSTMDPTRADDGRLYVLSAAAEDSEGRIYVIDASDTIGEGFFPARGSGNSLGRLGVIELGDIGGLDTALLPVDLLVVSSTVAVVQNEMRSLDRVAVVFDSLRGGPGTVAFLELTYELGLGGALVETTLLGSERVGPGPRQSALLPVFTGTSTVPVLVVPSSSSQTPEATVITLAEDAVTTSAPVTGRSTVDVGGPAREAVAAGRSVVVLRTDRPALVVLVWDGQQFIRAPRLFESSDTPVVDQPLTGGDRLGRIDLRSPPATAIYAPPGTFSVNLVVPGSVGPAILADAAEEPVLFIAQTDGLASFLVGDELELALTSTEAIVRTSPLTSFELGNNVFESPGLEECALTPATNSQNPVCNLDTLTSTVPLCTAGEDFIVESPGVSALYRAEFLGTIYGSREGRLKLVEMEESTGDVVFELTDEGQELAPFLTRDEVNGRDSLIRTGDRVRVHLVDPCPPSDEPGDEPGNGGAEEGDADGGVPDVDDRPDADDGPDGGGGPDTGGGSDGDDAPDGGDAGANNRISEEGRVEIFDAGPGEDLQLRVRFAPDQPLSQRCSDFNEEVVVGFYEVFPDLNDSSAILKRVLGEDIIEPLERVPFERVVSTSTRVRFRAQFASPLNLTLTSTRTRTSTTGPVLPCDLDDEGRALSPRSCQTDTECGPGRSCVIDSEMAPGCRGMCDDTCQASSSSCVSSERFHRCDGVEILVNPTRPVRIDLRDPDALPTETVVALPSHAVLNPVFPSFTVSSPGSRTLIEVIPAATGYIVDVVR